MVISGQTDSNVRHITHSREHPELNKYWLLLPFTLSQNQMEGKLHFWPQFRGFKNLELLCGAESHYRLLSWAQKLFKQLESRLPYPHYHAWQAVNRGMERAPVPEASRQALAKSAGRGLLYSVQGKSTLCSPPTCQGPLSEHPCWSSHSPSLKPLTEGG